MVVVLEKWSNEMDVLPPVSTIINNMWFEFFLFRFHVSQCSLQKKAAQQWMNQGVLRVETKWWVYNNGGVMMQNRTRYLWSCSAFHLIVMELMLVMWTPLMLGTIHTCPLSISWWYFSAGPKSDQTCRFHCCRLLEDVGKVFKIRSMLISMSRFVLLLLCLLFT